MKLILKNFLATLKRYKISSILNIIGLSMAFAALYIILAQVHYDLTYNKNIPDCQQIYRVEASDWDEPDKFMCWISRPLAEKSTEGISCIEHIGCGYLQGGNVEMSVEQDGAMKELIFNSTSGSLSFLKVFGFETVEGNMSDLEDTKRVAISVSAARKFNLKVGDVLYYGTNKDPEKAVHIAAIFKNFPVNTDLGAIEIFSNMGKQSIDDWREWSYNYYVKLHAKADINDFYQQNLQNISRILREQMEREGESEEALEMGIKRCKLHLRPLSDMYFATDIDNGSGNTGNKTTTYTLLAIAIFIVIIALINFINFFFALIPIRIKSVNTYKIFGSSLGTLRFNFIFEALGLAIISLLTGWYLVHLIAGSNIANYLTAPLALSLNMPIVIITVVTALIVALLASIYPAYYITSFPPAFVIKGSFAASKSGRRLRNVLIGLQFTISMGLIISTLFIKLQHTYMMNYDMGFNKEMLLAVNAPRSISNTLEKRDAFDSKLKENPQIKEVAWAAGNMVAESRMGWGRQFKGKRINFQCYPVSWNFLQFIGIQVTEGRDFTASDELKENGTFIFNHRARKEFDITLEDKVPGHAGETDVAGFCDDFNFKPLQYGVAPFAFYIFGKNPWWRPNHLYVRTTENANIESIIKYIKNSIVEFEPLIKKEKLNVRFFEEELGMQYQAEKKLTSLISLFTLLSIIISLMGVFGLVLFETQYKRKEIGVRRVHGASVGEILAIFNKKFVRIILICFVIAAPISWYIIDNWLGNFAYRTPMYWWVFAIALFIILCITVLLVTLRSFSAANENPVNCIKTNE